MYRAMVHSAEEMTNDGHFGLAFSMRTMVVTYEETVV